MSVSRILLVDDEADIRNLFTMSFSQERYEIFTAGTLFEAKKILEQNKIDLCLTDMRLPDGDGLMLLSEIQSQYPEVLVAMITAYGSMDLAIQALKQGAFDFINKPMDLTHLRHMVRDALASRNRSLRHEGHVFEEEVLLGVSECVTLLRSQIKKIAKTQAPVHIYGPSGSGKELVARNIHRLSPRATGPFVPINCGAIPESLLESELFGCKKGSFTGATEDRQGLLMAAQGGTLFFDEIAELPLNMQVKLLRVLQERKMRRIGDIQEISLDIRVLSATHKNLREQVRQGSFREDLFYRIHVIEIEVPSLASRLEDLPLLVDHLLEKNERMGHARKQLHPEALTKLKSYAFPGNIRELENLLQRASALSENSLIHPEDIFLPSFYPTESLPKASSDLLHSGGGLAQDLDRLEREKVLSALEQTRWNKTQAARLLGMTPRALRYRLEKWGL